MYNDFETQIQSDEFATEYADYIRWCEEVEVFMSQKKFDKSMFKKSPEELEQYLAFRRRGSKVESKKAYSRKDKHKNDRYRDCA